MNNKCVSIEELQKCSSEDKIISRIMDLLKKGTVPRKKDNVPTYFEKIWNELSVIDDLLLREERIIIPDKLQQKIVRIAHEGHLGVVNTKRLLRSKIWFRNLDALVEREINHCLTCQATVYQNNKEPLSMSDLLDGRGRK